MHAVTPLHQSMPVPGPQLCGCFFLWESVVTWSIIWTSWNPNVPFPTWVCPHEPTRPPEGTRWYLFQATILEAGISPHSFTYSWNLWGGGSEGGIEKHATIGSTLISSYWLLQSFVWLGYTKQIHEKLLLSHWAILWFKQCSSQEPQTWYGLPSLFQGENLNNITPKKNLHCLCLISIGKEVWGERPTYWGGSTCQNCKKQKANLSKRQKDLTPKLENHKGFSHGRLQGRP